MILLTTQKDPLKILSSTKSVLDHAQFVSINEENLADAAKKIETRFRAGFQMHERTKMSDDGIQLMFIEDAVNFCFWAGRNEAKWQVEKPDGTTASGWYGLEACFQRALRENIPLLDAHYLASLTERDGALLFRGSNGIEIPLLAERIKNLREIGMVLLEKFDGAFANLINAADHDATTIVTSVLEHFPSFRDKSMLDGKPVYFYKRAQIIAEDLEYVFAARGEQLKNINELTAFADYKLPQVFRMYGIFDYENSLEQRIDSYTTLAHDSREEIEIRAATIWAVELIRQRIPTMTAADIDNTVWLLSQDIQAETKPYHRTRTIFY